MSYGLETYTSAGVLSMSVTTRLTRLIYRRFLPANETSSVAVPNFSTTNCVALVVPRLPALNKTSSRAGHNISISGATVSWAPSTPSYRADSELLVFAYK